MALPIDPYGYYGVDPAPEADPPEELDPEEVVLETAANLKVPEGYRVEVIRRS